MTNPSIQLNQLPNDPSLADMLDQLKKEIFLDLNCHHIGTIQEFDPASQTAKVTVNYTKTFFTLNESTGTYTPVQVNYPTVIDCPVVVMGGGLSNLTMPVTAGDECLLLFNDRSIDGWFQSGQVGPVPTSRLHSFSDAIALVGVNSTPNMISNYDAIRALLTNGTVKVGINPQTNKITLTNGTTLLTLLTQLISAIQSLSIDVAGTGPNQGTVNAASVTALNTVITNLGGLLE